MLQHFNMFAHYNRWANAALYAEAAKLTREEFNRPTGAFFGSLMATLNHLLVADLIWLHRFSGEGSVPTLLNENLFAEFGPLDAARKDEDDRIIRWVGTLSEDAINGDFTYTPMTSPQSVTQKLGPALAHIFNHQTHHRGQAHMILTTLGKPSLALDLIYYHRTEEGRRWK
ncbi:putative damage-inducible protein DinB [Rhizobium aquaticum]|uniref:Damage-inducible protein DinB n=1 Tax=Rhizobium aquaticum TaxID=1549636 RepID=A0ABV2IXC3_9HYPH